MNISDYTLAGGFTLSEPAKQLLNDLDKATLALPNDSKVDFSDLQSNWLQGVVISNDRPSSLYDNAYKQQLRERLNKQKEEIEKLIEAVKKSSLDTGKPKEEENVCVDIPKPKCLGDKKEVLEDHRKEVIGDNKKDVQGEEPPKLTKQDTIVATLQKIIDEIDKNLNRIGNGEPLVSTRNNTLLGCYNRENKTIYLYWNNISACASAHNWSIEHLLAIVYVHEMFHAYFHQRAGDYQPIREIEEPMAELGMLLYLNNFGNNAITSIAKLFVEEKQQDGHLAAYGYAAFLFGYQKGPNQIQKDIIAEYAKKAKGINPWSVDVIRYSNALLLEYPMYPMGLKLPNGTEGELGLFNLLIRQILNVGQHQELSFLKLYQDAQQQIEDAVLERFHKKDISLHSADEKNGTGYEEQVKDRIKETMGQHIVVETMAPWESATPTYREGTDYSQCQGLIKYLPYKHQVEAWEKLLSVDNSSIVVTTGTGSGKTECFMLPLITDLAKQQQEGHGVQAIFLYPLNALMEDQKKKLSDLIVASGADLTFAVYNGNSPSAFNPQTYKKDPPKQGVLDLALSHEVVYREQIRGEQWDADQGAWVTAGKYPNIILTNPTMLEYLLMRKADECIIQNSRGSLRWIVIDETHTFTGASADELAMLLRRVLNAFGTSADQLHFATSSATVGNDDNELRQFIERLTGTSNLSIISGDRSFPSFSLATSPSQEALCAYLATHNYADLQQLPLDNGNSIEDRLKELDRLALGGLKVKVHFYAKALTNGLFVDLQKAKGQKQFELYQDIPWDNSTNSLNPHYVRAVFCSHCGELLAEIGKESVVEERNSTRQQKYKRIGLSSSDKKYYIAINRQQSIIDKNSQWTDVDANRNISTKNNQAAPFLLSAEAKCPCCGAKEKDGDERILLSFNTSSVTTMQSITPVLLDSASKTNNNPPHPHDGQQFISFADSRKSAARPSLIQNLATEEQWVITTILKELARRGKPTTLLKWQEAVELLYNDSNCERLALCFAKDDDIDWVNGTPTIKGDYRRRYALGALYNVLHKRSKNDFSPESHGLIRVGYPQLDEMIDRMTEENLPEPVKALNSELKEKDPNSKQINPKDWKNFLKIYLDFEVRSNENLYYHETSSTGWKDVDIAACRNLNTQYERRRSIKDPRLSKDGRMYKLLYRLFGCDDRKSLDALGNGYGDFVDKVIGEMWKVLTNGNILTPGQYIDENGNWTPDNTNTTEGRTNYRLNLVNMSFDLFDDVYLDDNVKCTLDTVFMDCSPYWVDRKYNNTHLSHIQNWDFLSNRKDLSTWLATVGASYLYCMELKKVADEQPVFIQVEHTAQVDRKLTRARLEQFKQHEINILACSTTMEMGVDIGELEIVSMANIPPHPANYKQRAGRAGRASQNKSVCTTICQSDSIGSFVFGAPISRLLEREVATPSTPLNSPQIVQRHINAFLLREFIKSLPQGANNYKDFTLCDFFLPQGYSIQKVGFFLTLRHNNADVYPNKYNSILSPQVTTSYYIDFCNWLINTALTPPQIQGTLTNLLQQTNVGITFQNAIQGAKTTIEKVYGVFKEQIEMIGDAATNISIWNLSGRNPNKYAIKLNYNFVGLLNQNLRDFLSTNQFTLNANMPLNIIRLNISKENYKNAQWDKDPQRDLRTALSEYAPESRVVIDGKTYTIAGVEWDKHQNSIESICYCRDCKSVWKTVAGATSTGCQQCGAGAARISLYKMLIPTAFIPEPETSRITDTTEPTMVEAHLLGATEWEESGDQKNLYAIRLGTPEGNAKILYLNRGDENGYCICKKCGRAKKQDKLNPQVVDQRKLMFSDESTTNLGRYQHKSLLKGDNDDIYTQDSLYTDMVFGGEIQTNYSELKPYHYIAGRKFPFNPKKTSSDRKVLITLGLAICDELSKYIACQRTDIDFMVTVHSENHKPALALCIYDTAKGGAGYSSQLDDKLWNELLLQRCAERFYYILAKGENPLSALLARYTMRYAEEIDVQAAYNWLLEMENYGQPVPPSILSVYPTAQCYTRASLIQSVVNSNGIDTPIVFFSYNNSSYKDWNYSEDKDDKGVLPWNIIAADIIKKHIAPASKCKVVLQGYDGATAIPMCEADMLKQMEIWAEFNKCTDTFAAGIYPLAHVDGWLFFTDKSDNTVLNGSWAKDNVYTVHLDQTLNVTPQKPVSERYYEFFLPQSTHIYSNELLDLVLKQDGSNTIKDFIDRAKGHPLKFTYVDEHLKTQLAMCITFQFIKSIIDSAQSDINQCEIMLECEKYTDNGGSYKNDTSRKLYDTLYDDADRDDLWDELVNQLHLNISATIKSNGYGKLPHYRKLEIEDLKTGALIVIKPHGGLHNEWNFDNLNNNRKGGVLAEQYAIRYSYPYVL